MGTKYGSIVIGELSFPIDNMWFAGGSLWITGTCRPIVDIDADTYTVYGTDGEEVYTSMRIPHRFRWTKSGCASYTVTLEMENITVIASRDTKLRAE